MELVRENIQTRVSSAELEAQKHNAMIKERYRRLQNAEADQFATGETVENRVAEKAQANVVAPEKPALYISPSTINTATLEQTPRVTEYVSPASSALFTTEKFERMQGYEEEVAYTAPAAVSAPVTTAAVSAEAHYSLSAFAKIAMAVFTLVIVAMLTLICVNTQLISQKRIRIQNLEEKQEQLMEMNEEIQRRIENARSEETIREYALSQGMVQVGN